MNVTNRMLALLLLAGPAVAQQPALRSGAFVTTLGRDTMSVETYTRSATRLEGHILASVPRAIVVEYTVDFDAEGNTRELRLTGRLVGAAEDLPPLLERHAVLKGDTVYTIVRRNGQPDTSATGRLVTVRGVLPFISNSTAILEEVGHRWRTAGRDSSEFSMFVFGPQGAGAPAPIKRFRGDTLMIVNGPGQTPLLYLDAEGRLQLVDSRLTTVQTMTRRTSSADMERISQRFAAMGIVGIPSPRDTARAKIAGAELQIDYGRPRARGRKVFGGIVPYGQVWRTGANLATHFRTSQDLVIGQQRIPAGSYTLWSVPGEAGDTLIISRQTGQWGTQYDPSQDLARVPLRTEQLSQPVEQFSITIEPAGQSQGVIVFTWERRRMSVPFRTG